MVVDTTQPYDKVKRDPIQYTYCKEFKYISRYQNLRQVIHEQYSLERYVALEFPNRLESNAELQYYTVPAQYEDRLDLIANDLLGSAKYKWVICYFNDILDGFTVKPDTILKLPQRLMDLMQHNELLEAISITNINLGSE